MAWPLLRILGRAQEASARLVQGVEKARTRFAKLRWSRSTGSLRSYTRQLVENYFCSYDGSPPPRQFHEKGAQGTDACTSRSGGAACSAMHAPKRSFPVVTFVTALVFFSGAFLLGRLSVPIGNSATGSDCPPGVREVEHTPSLHRTDSASIKDVTLDWPATAPDWDEMARAAGLLESRPPLASAPTGMPNYVIQPFQVRNMIHTYKHSMIIRSLLHPIGIVMCCWDPARRCRSAAFRATKRPTPRCRFLDTYKQTVIPRPGRIA